MSLYLGFITLIGIFASILDAYAADLLITPIGDKQIRALNRNIMFTCTVTDADTGVDPQLQWFDQANRHIVEQAGSRKYVEPFGQDTLKLYITSIEASDAGRYICRGQLEGNQVEKSVELLLFEDISFEHAPSVQNPAINTNYTIQCQVSGQPIPRVSWRYNGQLIKNEGRYSYVPDGLRVTNIQESDNGRYTCRAEVAEDGRLEEKDIQVEVHIPPTITKELGDNEGIEDQEVSISCRATGKPDPKYEFYRGRNENKLWSNDRIEVDEDAGVIHFRTLKKIDEDNYICKAVNNVGEKRSEGFLRVIVPPRITTLENRTALEGTAGELLCVSEGDPPPQMTFKKVGNNEAYITGENEGGRIIVQDVSSNNLKMTINNVSPIDTSNYTCKATNMAGTFERNGTLAVHFAPRFDPQHIREVYSWPGKTKNMTCHSLGEPTPHVEWRRYGRLLETNETYKIFDLGRTAVLQVKVRDVDVNWIYGEYECQANNQHGDKTLVMKLERATVPGKPKSVEVKDRSPTMVVFTVAPPEENGGVEIDGYRIEYDNHIQDFLLSQEIRIENLKPSTSYIFRIRAKNEVGAGNYLEHAFTTDAIREPYPLVITSDRQGDYPYSYVLRWEKPRTGGLAIREYEFKYRRIQVVDGTWELLKPETDYTNLQVEDDPIRPMLFYTLEGLNAEAYYEVEAKARNDINWSTPSVFIFKTTKDNNQGNMVGEVVGGGSLTVTGSLLCIATGYLATLL